MKYVCKYYVNTVEMKSKRKKKNTKSLIEKFYVKKKNKSHKISIG